MTEAETLEVGEKGSGLSFNLWERPWIGIVWPDGTTDRLSIHDTLLRAHEIKALYDPSPLVVAATHRLLAAILQDIYRPQRVGDIGDLLQSGKFEAKWLELFGRTYAARFDLFSETAPFMQTSDIPLAPVQHHDLKPASTLFFEEPSGTYITHFWHFYEDRAFCPACAACGLVLQPAFASSGGSGIKPSINGVPPIYVLPVGDTLFDALSLSLVMPGYQPAMRDEMADRPIWASRKTIVAEKEEVRAIGYVESLTFLPRRMRLFPSNNSRQTTICTRCGARTGIFISELEYKMGRTRAEGLEVWMDPFAAYKLPNAKSEQDYPRSVRPTEGKAVWREYMALFLSQANRKDLQSPGVVQQVADLQNEGYVGAGSELRFRCVGVRTDGKGKIFEWVDETLDVPVGLLKDEASAQAVLRGIERAEQFAKDILSIFRESFRPQKEGKREHYIMLRGRMEANYWVRLAPAFHELTLSAADVTSLRAAEGRWAKEVLQVGEDVFIEATDGVSNLGNDLRSRVKALQELRKREALRRKEWLSD